MKRKKRVRKNFTLLPSAIKGLERLAHDMDISMSRVLEAALDALREKRAAARVTDEPRTWEQANRLLDSLPNKSDLEKKNGEDH